MNINHIEVPLSTSCLVSVYVSVIFVYKSWISVLFSLLIALSLMVLGNKLRDPHVDMAYVLLRFHCVRQFDSYNYDSWFFLVLTGRKVT